LDRSVAKNGTDSELSTDLLRPVVLNMNHSTRVVTFVAFLNRKKSWVSIIIRNLFVVLLFCRGEEPALASAPKTSIVLVDLNGGLTDRDRPILPPRLILEFVL